MIHLSFEYADAPCQLKWNNWIYCGSRPKRSMNSVIIAEETKQLLLEDAKDFADSEEWYGQRGIPWQRGWLLYGKYIRGH